MTANGDELYMRRALELARHGELGASPNPMVGAVIVAEGRVIGEGYHARCGGPHAEVRAMDSVGERDRQLIAGSTVYVTLEPCAHYGKTPPCAKMLVEKRVGRVVVGCVDTFAKVSGRGIAMLREAGIDVTVGVLESDCRWLNRKFFTAHGLKRPYITLKWACSADGWMDCERTDSHPGAARFSSPVSGLEVMRLRAANDAILVGANTVVADNPSLTVRGICGHSPVRVVLDPGGTLPDDSRVFAPDGTRVVRITDVDIDLAALMGELYESGITSLLVEGGSRTLRHFLDAGLWDEVRREMAPVILGGNGRVQAPQLPRGITEVAECDRRTITRVVSAEVYAR